MNRRGFLTGILALGVASVTARASVLTKEAIAQGTPLFGLAPIKQEGTAVVYDHITLALGGRNRMALEIAMKNTKRHYDAKGILWRMEPNIVSEQFQGSEPIWVMRARGSVPHG